MKSLGIATRFAAAGLLACLLISTNSSATTATWQDVRSTVATRGIATNGTVYVGAAANGIWTSTDLSTWQHASLPATAGISYNDILWDGSRFIAVGQGVITSTDGSTWTLAMAPSSARTWGAIAMMTGTYVAVGSDITHVLTSSDGQSWTLTATGLSASSFPSDNHTNTSFTFTGVATNGSGFVAIGDAYAPDTGFNLAYADITASSTDGSSWTVDTLPSVGSAVYDSSPINGIAWGAGTYVAGGDTGVYTSPDGTTWTAHSLPFSPPEGFRIYTRIQFINGQFVAVGTDLKTFMSAVSTSPDGVTWTESSVAASTDNFQALSWAVFTGSDYVVGGAGDSYSSTSSSGWTVKSTTPQPVIGSCLVSGGGKFVAPGTGGYVSSSDGTTWPATVSTSTAFGDAFAPDCAAYGDNMYVVIAGNDLFEESSDGNNWSLNDPAVSGVNLQAIAWTGNKFFTVAQNTGTTPDQPLVQSSTDGGVWSNVTTTGLPAGITSFGLPGDKGGGLAYMNSHLVAWGLDSSDVPFIALSSDGSTWTTASVLSAGEDVAAVAYGNGEYLAIGNDASGDTLVLTSSSGTSWSSPTTVPLSINAHWDELILGDSEFVATGVDADTGQGLILNSSSGSTWTLTTPTNIGEIKDVAWNGTSYVAVSQYDVLEYTPAASSGGGGGSGGGTKSSGGGGSFDILALTLLSGFALGRRPRR